MSALTEKPNAEPLPASSGAAILQNSHYLPAPSDKDGKIWVRTTALVQRGAHELYAMWRDLSRAPEWQEQLTDVVITGERTSHWTMQIDDKTLNWNSEILADEPGKRIAWRSVDGDIHEAGEVVFEPAPGGRGTFVVVLMAFEMSKVASAWQTFTDRNPKQRVIENVRHFKALAEAGEIPRSQSSPHGERGVVGGLKRGMYGEKIPTPLGEAN